LTALNDRRHWHIFCDALANGDEMPNRCLDGDADVIVVGGGAAGLAAAIEAAELGASVILLEKNPALGGSMAWSVGSISATKTPHQRKAGIDDNADDHFEDLEVLAGVHASRDNLDLRRMLVDHTTEMLSWLEASGLVFVGPTIEPPHRTSRMHNVVPSSKAFPYHLGRRARRAGVDIRLGNRASRLVLEGDRVTGVEIEGAAGKRSLRAKSGVILAAGDYSGSRELKAKFAGAEVCELEPVNVTATGDGFQLALEIGAEMVNGDIVRGPIMRFVPPSKTNLIGKLPPWRPLALIMKWSYANLPNWLLRPFMMSFLTTALGPSVDLFRQGALLINKKGNRFIEETNRPGIAVPHQPDRLAYIVMDARIAAKFTRWPYYVSTAPGVSYAYLTDYRRNRKDIYASGRTPADLAAAIGVDPKTLTETIEQYKLERESRSGNFPAFDSGPYVALGPVRSFVVFTDGGLRVSTKLEVLKNGKPIPGLYAAGSNGQGGLLLEGHGHHLGWGFISGRIAAANIVAEARLNRPAAPEKQSATTQ
jgi:succinate dehydrogenase/fumarate reductase flavoprotein subunit